MKILRRIKKKRKKNLIIAIFFALDDKAAIAE
jgi:hypothetical protein